MRSLLNSADPKTTAATRIVCLPGAYNGAEDFLRAGFDHHVRRRALPIDLVFVDVEMQHLGDRSILDRLRRDVVHPARTLGCRSLWLAGISLGGFIALDYAASNPGDIDGLCLLAPYLGNRVLLAEIARAPTPHGGQPEAADEERRIWQFVNRGTGIPRLHLGYGDQDRFAPGHRLMAGMLPPTAVDVVPGGHDWPTWTVLWENFLAATFPSEAPLS